MTSPMAAPSLYWTEQAWLSDGWADGVLLEAGTDGLWASVSRGVAEPPAGATVLAGPVLPGLVDAHSHAFQRSFAGLAEQRDGAHDDFWSWRERMYTVANRVGPDELRAIATHLYVELLRGGYTQVCEFHYLHHRPDGARFDDPLEMSWALADAAAEAGIGLTMLPVLYERAGFGQSALRHEQRRFAAGVDEVLAMRDALRAGHRPLLSAGCAVHSLRGATARSILRLAEAAGPGPLHIHVAEQMAEVHECLAHTGSRPIEWLVQHAPVDRRWLLVHATHAGDAERQAVAACDAAVVLCPSTEANLGDGVFDLPGWLACEVPIAIGSDSHVTRGWREELRLAEYAQRLLLRRRNVAAAPETRAPSTAARLWSTALDGGGRAAGFAAWGLVPGARADLLVVDLRDASLLGVPPKQLLDALVFSSPGRPWRDVMVAGRWVVEDHRHAGSAAIGTAYTRALERCL